MQQIVTQLLHPLRARAGTLARAALTAAASLAGAVTLAPAPAGAQGLFSPAIVVNDDIITQFELDQRIRFMQMLNAPGKPELEARKALIDDRLKRQQLARFEITVAEEDVQAGMEEFAARGNLPLDQFLSILNQGGVARETLRDFIEIQIGWRDYIAGRYGSRARPTEAEIDRALAAGGAAGGVQVLLSEVIIPITPQTLPQVEALAAEIAGVTSYEAFSAAATQYSASDTRSQGGRLDWLPVTDLPPALQPLILALSPGEVTEPITLPNAVALFQMRGIRETSPAAPRYSAIEYAAYYMAGGRSPETLAAAARLRETVDTCDDLYAVAKDQPPQVLERVSQAPGAIPRDIALELAKLDTGEVSTALTRSNGQTLVFLMLCGRTNETVGEATRADIAQALTERRLAAFAESLLAQLRADAIIEDR